MVPTSEATGTPGVAARGTPGVPTKGTPGVPMGMPGVARPAVWRRPAMLPDAVLPMDARGSCMECLGGATMRPLPNGIGEPGVAMPTEGTPGVPTKGGV